jgi:hypothetical protein
MLVIVMEGPGARGTIEIRWTLSRKKALKIISPSNMAMEKSQVYWLDY